MNTKIPLNTMSVPLNTVRSWDSIAERGKNGNTGRRGGMVLV